MRTTVVRLPDGRLAIPLDDADARALLVAAGDQVTVRVHHEILEATKVSKYDGMTRADLARIDALPKRRNRP